MTHGHTATPMVTPITHGQTDGDAIEHDQTHKSDPHNQQKPIVGAQPKKIHRSTTTNKNPQENNN